MKCRTLLGILSNRCNCSSSSRSACVGRVCCRKHEPCTALRGRRQIRGSRDSLQGSTGGNRKDGSISRGWILVFHRHVAGEVLHCSATVHRGGTSLSGASGILEKDRRPNSYLPHHLQEFAKFYEAHGKDEPAEVLYRRALALCEELQGPNSLHTACAAEALAAFCRTRHRYAEAEELYHRSLTIEEEGVRSQTAAWTKGWRQWRKKRELQIRLSLSQIPISTSLDHLATVKRMTPEARGRNNCTKVSAIPSYWGNNESVLR